jgi:hypothetical protein
MDLFLAVFEDYMAERARELAARQVDLAEDASHMEFIAYASRNSELAGRFGTRSAALREAVAHYIAGYQGEAGEEFALPPDELALVLRVEMSRQGGSAEPPCKRLGAQP